jgi:hypothetical protein
MPANVAAINSLVVKFMTLTRDGKKNEFKCIKVEKRTIETSDSSEVLKEMVLGLEHAAQDAKFYDSADFDSQEDKWNIVVEETRKTIIKARTPWTSSLRGESSALYKNSKMH